MSLILCNRAIMTLLDPLSQQSTVGLADPTDSIIGRKNLHSLVRVPVHSVSYLIFLQFEVKKMVHGVRVQKRSQNKYLTYVHSVL